MNCLFRIFFASCSLIILATETQSHGVFFLLCLQDSKYSRKGEVASSGKSALPRNDTEDCTSGRSDGKDCRCHRAA